MKDRYIVANWKANKTEAEGIAWLEEFYSGLGEITGIPEGCTAIVCPPFTLLSQMKKYIDANNLPLTLGSQDVSKFDKGAYTGEIPVDILQELVKYCIIGHSERRQNFEEDQNVLNEKVKRALSKNLIPIFCVQGEDTQVPEGISLVAYEPVEAIGTGNPDTPENAEKIASAIKSKNPSVSSVLYGGSVTSENVKSFIDQENISGVLVGGASLDASSFVSLLKQCEKN